ncbi:MAG: flagellar filament capping protein FliD [Alphaproteobacteria bacterium]
MVDSTGLYGAATVKTNEKTGGITVRSDTFDQAIEGMHKARMLKVEKQEEKLEAYQEKLGELAELESKIKALADHTRQMYYSNKYGDAGELGKRIAVASTDTTKLPEELVDINVDPKCNLKEISLKVKQKASYDISTATSGVADHTAALGWTGDFTINGTSIPVTADMSLQDIVHAGNNSSVSDLTFAKLSVVKSSDNDYRLSVQSTKLASPLVITDTLDTNGDPSTAVPADSGKTVSELSAKFDFNGLTDIISSSNTISDVADGLTIVLKAADPATTIGITIENDKASAMQSVLDFAEKYNEFNDVLQRNRAFDIETQQPGEDAILYGKGILNTLDTKFRGLLQGNAIGAGANDLQNLTQFGITLDRHGKMSVDDTKLSDNILNNFDKFLKLFEFNFESSSRDFVVSDHPATMNKKIVEDSNGNPVTTNIKVLKDGAGEITVELSVVGGDFNGKTYTIPSDKIKTYGGSVIEFNGTDAIDGGAELPYKDVVFRYVGIDTLANGASVDADMTFSQGFSDRVTKTVENLTNIENGLFKAEKDTMTTEEEKLKEEIETLTRSNERKRERDERQFSKLEAFMAQMEPLKAMTDAFMQSVKNSKK